MEVARGAIVHMMRDPLDVSRAVSNLITTIATDLLHWSDYDAFQPLVTVIALV